MRKPGVYKTVTDGVGQSEVTPPCLSLSLQKCGVPVNARKYYQDGRCVDQGFCSPNPGGRLSTEWSGCLPTEVT